MPVNIGIAPPASNTEVSEFRYITGDSVFTPIEGKVGYGEYRYWSDLEVESFLRQGGSITKAIAAAYLQMAASHAQSGMSIKTDDLSYSNIARGTTWMELARIWQAKADAEDASAADSGFDIVQHGSNLEDPFHSDQGSRRPEGAPFRLDALGGWL